MQNFDIEKIHNTVWVFHNAIKNPQEVIDYFTKNTVWDDWYTFGKMIHATGHFFEFNSFPTQEEWNSKNDKNNFSNIKENKIVDEINNVFYETTKLYVHENNVNLNDWIFSGWNVAKYMPNPKDHSRYVMHHHTDYQRERSYEPGLQFGITAVFYLNDDYDGGEVEFRFVKDESLEVVVEDYNYKPKAGDVVVFLSGHPHYHGVRPVSNGEKYIIRTYWRFNQDAHPKWLELKEKYGEEIWKKMEEDRLKFSYKGENQIIINNIPKFIDFEEYYNKLENKDI